MGTSLLGFASFTGGGFKRSAVDVSQAAQTLAVSWVLSALESMWTHSLGHTGACGLLPVLQLFSRCFLMDCWQRWTGWMWPKCEWLLLGLPLLLGHENKPTAHSPASMVLFFIIPFQHCHTYEMSQLWSFQLQVVNWKQENANHPPPAHPHKLHFSLHKYLPVAVNEFWIFVEIKSLLFLSNQSMFMSR